MSNAFHLQIAGSTVALVLLVVVETYLVRFTTSVCLYKLPVEDTVNVVCLGGVWVRCFREVVIYASVYINMIVVDRVGVAWRVFSAAEGNVAALCRCLWPLHAVFARGWRLGDVDGHANAVAYYNGAPIAACIEILACANVVEVNGFDVFVG